MRVIEIEQGSDQWHVERFRCVTGTRFESAIGAGYSEVTGMWNMGGFKWSFEGDKLVNMGELTDKQKLSCESKQSTLLYDLVSEFQSELEIDDYCSETMERGNDLEPLSVVAASKRHKVSFESCGMLASDTNTMYKFSPDAIYKDKELVIVGGYETKSKAGKKHIEYKDKNRVPPEHLLQCLCPMVMDDCVKWWIFGHYDDRNHVDPLFTTGIKRENYEDFINIARDVLSEFCHEVKITTERMGGIYHG